MRGLARNSAPAVWILCTLALGACSSEPPPRTAAEPGAAVASRAEVETARAEAPRRAAVPAEPVRPVVDEAEAGPKERPVRRKMDPDATFPPAPPDGVRTIHTPTVLRTPPVRYAPRPLAPGEEPWFLPELPVPRRTQPADPRAPGRSVPGVIGSEGGPPEGLPSPAFVGGTPDPLAPALSSDFDSTDFVTNISHTGFAFIPADPSGAAGPNHVVSVTNVTLRVHEKDGTLVVDTPLASFFSGLGPLTFTFDPRVIYDQHAGRFVLLTLEQTDDGAGGAVETSRILVAVSDDNDPTGTWFSFAIDARTLIGSVDHWADYPGLGVDEEALYITANMFSFFASGGTYGGVRLWVIDKGLGTGGFYDGGVTSLAVLDPYGGGGIAVTTQPAHVFGPAPAGVGTFLVSYDGLTNGATEAVQVVRIDDPLGSPTFTQQFVDVGNLEQLNAALPPAPQDTSSLDVATNDRRALNAVWIGGDLWLTATIDPKNGDPDAGEATAHWWRLDTSSLGALAVADQGSVLGEDIATDTFTFYPAVAVNGAGQMALGFSGSAASLFPGSYYTTRLPTDAAGTTSASGTLRAGTAFYERLFCFGSNRWGDYSSVSVDPVDGCFWIYNKHAISRGSGTDCDDDMVVDEDGRWGTAFGKVCPAGACPSQMVLAEVALAGTQTRKAAHSIRTAEGVSVATGADVTLRAGSRVIFEDGFSVADGASLTVEIPADPCL